MSAISASSCLGISNVASLSKRLWLLKLVWSVHVDCKANDDDEDGVVAEGCVRHVVRVFVPDAPALHFHPLPIVLAHRRLHDVLVPLVLLQTNQCFLCLQADLLCKSILPILPLLSPLAPFFSVVVFVVRLIFIVLILSLNSSISLLVLADEVW